MSMEMGRPQFFHRIRQELENTGAGTSPAAGGLLMFSSIPDVAVIANPPGDSVPLAAHEDLIQRVYPLFEKGIELFFENVRYSHPLPPHPFFSQTRAGAQTSSSSAASAPLSQKGCILLQLRHLLDEVDLAALYEEAASRWEPPHPETLDSLFPFPFLCLDPKERKTFVEVSGAPRGWLEVGKSHAPVADPYTFDEKHLLQHLDKGDAWARLLWVMVFVQNREILNAEARKEQEQHAKAQRPVAMAAASRLPHSFIEYYLSASPKEGESMVLQRLHQWCQAIESCDRDFIVDVLALLGNEDCDVNDVTLLFSLCQMLFQPCNNETRVLLGHHHPCFCAFLRAFDAYSKRDTGRQRLSGVDRTSALLMDPQGGICLIAINYTHAVPARLPLKMLTWKAASSSGTALSQLTSTCPPILSRPGKDADGLEWSYHDVVMALGTTRRAKNSQVSKKTPTTTYSGGGLLLQEEHRNPQPPATTAAPLRWSSIFSAMLGRSASKPKGDTTPPPPPRRKL
jgi:hypothetical protein